MENVYMSKMDFNISKTNDYSFTRKVPKLSENIESEWSSLELVDMLDAYYKPTFSSLGLLLNSISVTVFLNTELNKLSVSHYLIAIGIMDNFYLFTVIIPWLSKYGIGFFTTMGICQLVLYLSHYSRFLSCWYMTLMIMQRSSKMYSQGLKRRFESVLQAKFIILMIAIFAGVGFLYVTWTHGVVDNPLRCTILPENESQIQLLKKIELFFSFIFPWIVSCVFLLIHLFKNCMCYKWCFADVIQTKIEAQGNAMLANFIGGSVKTKWSVRTFDHVETPSPTVMDTTMNISCIFVATFFLLSSLPYMIIKIRISYMNETYKSLLLLYKSLYLINFVVKFFIYLSIPEFRKAITRAFGGLHGHKTEKEMTQRSVFFPRVNNKTRILDTTDL